MTGKEMTEAFFTKVKGWKWVEKEGTVWIQSHWRKPDKGFYMSKELPAIYKSLDLQEEWVWPELYKNNWVCMDVDYDVNRGIHKITLMGGGDLQTQVKAPTKPLAQLESSLKALGVL